MNEDTSAEAQRRANQIRAFAAELSELEAERILSLSSEQKQRIDAYHARELDHLRRHHDVDLHERSGQLSVGMQVVSFIGAWALAASVFFFFRQYWGLAPAWLQVAVLVGVSVLSLWATALIARRDGPARYFAKIAAMISVACFMLNVALLGHLFNLPPSPMAAALYAFYAAILAYALRVRLLLAVAILCLFAFVGAQSATYSGLYWLSVGERPEHFILPTLLLFWLPSLWRQSAYRGFASIYRVLSLSALSLVVLVLSNWGGGSYLPGSHSTIEAVYQLIGFALSGAAIGLGIRWQWPPVVATGNVFFFLFLYTKFFDWWWDWLPKSLFFLLIGLTALLALLALFVFSRLRRMAQPGGEP